MRGAVPFRFVVNNQPSLNFTLIADLHPPEFFYGNQVRKGHLTTLERVVWNGEVRDQVKYPPVTHLRDV